MNNSFNFIAGITIMFFIASVVVIYFRYLKHKETLHMIEKGMVEPPKPKNGRDSLRWGIVITAIGVALSIGVYPFGFLVQGVNFPLKFGPWMLIGLVPTFFGLALILIHYLTQKNGIEEHDEGGEETENEVDRGDQ